MLNTEEIKQLIAKNTEEVIGEKDLDHLLQTNTQLNHYIGFEISGLMHLGTGMMTALKIRDFVKAGVKCRILLADWHTWINHKLGQDIDLIRDVALGYFKGMFEEIFKLVGIPDGEVELILGSDLYHNNDKYWFTVVDVADSLSLGRIKQMLEIMGRSSSEEMRFSRLIYPTMQIADHYIMHLNLVHSGTDQRKATVKGREVANRLRVSPIHDTEGSIIKPVGVTHHLLQGLQKPDIWPITEELSPQMRTSLKMSKSIPGSAIWVHDSPEEIRSKIKDAFCPPGIAEFNPIMDWCKHFIFEFTDELYIKRLEKHGGDLTFRNYNELEELYVANGLHPDDLKNAVIKLLVQLLTPVRVRAEDYADIIHKLGELNKK